MRTIVIGDVQGCLEELDELVRAVDYVQGRDRLILAGDLLDRGPDSIGVVRRALELGAEAVLGNHEDWHIRFWKHEDKAAQDPGYENPLRMARSYTGEREHTAQRMPEHCRKWIRELPLYLHVDDRWTVVHAGCLPGIPVEDQEYDVLTHLRYVRKADNKMEPLNKKMLPETHAFWTDLWRGPRSIVYGHHAEKRGAVYTINPSARRDMVVAHPMFNGTVPFPGDVNTLGIDTGCCFGGTLTAAIFHGGGVGIVSVPARGEYAKAWSTPAEQAIGR